MTIKCNQTIKIILVKILAHNPAHLIEVHSAMERKKENLLIHKNICQIKDYLLKQQRK